MTDSRGCEHEGTKVETASNRLNGVADPEGATPGPIQFFLELFDQHMDGEIQSQSMECAFL